VVINDLDLVRIAILPAEADPPLVIHADAVLPCSIAFELLEAIAWRDAKVIEGFGGIDGDEFTEHDATEIGRIPADGLPAEEAHGIPRSLGSRHNVLTQGARD
jgi:hypothetical protein